MRIILILLITTSVFYPQELEKWGKKDVPYAENLESGGNESGGVLNAVKDVYRFLISDVDGDNCPFTPTCSSFFTEAASEYGVFFGGLMFADRFTRDLNLLKLNKYPLSAGGKFEDPPDLYFFDDKTVLTVLRNIKQHE